MSEQIKKPNLFIVGAAKAGTTALHTILSNHPEVFMSPVKEPNFFSTDIEYEKLSRGNKIKFKNIKIEFDSTGNIIPRHFMFIKDELEYMGLFKFARESIKIVGESSVSYLYSKDAAKNIFKFNNEAKIVIVLRDPIDRAISHYKMILKTRGQGAKDILKTFHDDYCAENKTWGGDSHLFIELGLYYEQVKRFTDIFPREHILFIDYSEFKTKPITVLNNLSNFLSISGFTKNEPSKHNEGIVPKNSMARLLLKSRSLKRLLSSVLKDKHKKMLKSTLLSNKKAREINLTKEDRIKLDKYFKSDLDKLDEFLNIRIIRSNFIN